MRAMIIFAYATYSVDGVVAEVLPSYVLLLCSPSHRHLFCVVFGAFPFEVIAPGSAQRCLMGTTIIAARDIRSGDAAGMSCASVVNVFPALFQLATPIMDSGAMFRV